MRSRRAAPAVAAVLAAGLALSGCTASGTTVGALAKTAGWRDGAADGTRLLDGWSAQLELAYDATTAGALWDSVVRDGLPDASGRPERAGRYGDLADVDFATQVVGLWSAGESGSCPEWLASVTTSGAGEVSVRTGHDGDTCTADYVFYSEVVVLDRSAVPPADALPATATMNGSATAGVLAFGG